MFLLLLLLPSALPCGMTTHNVIAHRAASYFFHAEDPKYAEIIRKHRNSYLGGAPFPDYLYACGKDHDFGEFAHWSPFQAAAAKYIRSLPTPWSEETEKLVAFFLGVVSHYIADINWHGLAESPHGYGFIETEGLMDFNCSGNLCSTAHTAADTGGEFVARFQTELGWLHPVEWHVPAEDIVKVYAIGGYHNVTVSSIMECHAIFIAAVEAIKDVSEAVFIKETEKAPFLTEHYISHPFGGVDDMAVWSGRMWNRFAGWLESGPPDPVPPVDADSDHIAHLRRSWEQRRDFLLKMATLGKGKVQRGARISKEMAEYDGSNHASNNREWLAAGGSPLEYFGAALCRGDFDADGVEDIVYGAYGTTASPASPQMGAVHINCSSSLQTLSGHRTYGRFGWAVAVLDFNKDGIDDLVVSSPSAGWNWNATAVSPLFQYATHQRNQSTRLCRYHGAVDVFFGHKGSGVSSTPDISIVSKEVMESFGTVLSVGDVDNDGSADLIVGCPFARASESGIQRGHVKVYYSNVTRHTGQRLEAGKADLVLLGKNDFEMLGHHVTVIDDPVRGKLLLVGAPGHRRIEHGKTVLGTVGAVYAFAIPHLTQAFVLAGSELNAKFGHAFAFGSEHLLAIGQPSAGRNSGAVLVVSLASFKGYNVLTRDQCVASISESSYGARFGWRVGFADITGDGHQDLYVSAPLFSTILNHNEGAVFVYNGVPKGAVDAAEAAARSFRGGVPKARFGEACIAVEDSLVVGQPRLNVGSNEMAGAVHQVYPAA